MNTRSKSSKRLLIIAQDELYPFRDRADCILELATRINCGKKVFQLPWSFVSHIEGVLKACRLAGFEREIPTSRLRTEMMRVTGVTNSKKLAEYIRVMIELGYVRAKGDLVVEFCLSFALPYQFASDSASVDAVVPGMVKDGKSKD